MLDISGWSDVCLLLEPDRWALHPAGIFAGMTPVTSASLITEMGTGLGECGPDQTETSSLLHETGPPITWPPPPFPV